MCSYTPRFSYEGPETAVSTVGHCSNGRVQGAGAGQDGYTGGYPGWVYRVGNTGVHPVTTLCSRRVPSDSEAGPEALQGLEWWSLGARTYRRLDGPCTHPSGARSGMLPSLVQDPRDCRLLANNGEI